MRFSPVDTGNTGSGAYATRVWPVQPRGYGEHGFKRGFDFAEYGSAPWIRGTPLQVNKTVYEWRFSPVDTGNTTQSKSTESGLAVQPRGYGEHKRS